MPVFALYHFDDTDVIARDAALDNGAQDGFYMGGATTSGGQVLLDGVDDFAKISVASEFQMDRGTLGLRFSQTAHVGTGPNTILSRDSAGLADGGGFRMEVLADGTLNIHHETATETVSWTTGPGFMAPGHDVELTYSWDFGGTEPGRLVLVNHSTDGSFVADVPNTLTMDMGSENQHWTVGAGRSGGPSEANTLGMERFFQGAADWLYFSDTKDNLGNQPPEAVDDRAETDEDVPVVIDVLGNDSDPDGGTLRVTSATATNGTVTINPDGTLTYTPHADWHGDDTIHYTITDGQGGTASAIVEVVVHPVNDDPVANPDSATTGAGVPIVILPAANDTDVDGDDLEVIAVGTSPNGTVVLNPDGSVTFTPNPGFTGVAEFDYTISDGAGGTASSTVTVTVTPGPARDGYVRGTDGGDLIDADYIDPWDADRIDRGDAILPGDAPDDDRVIAGDGDDTVLAGAGDDTVWAGRGDDEVYGGDGSDSLDGGAGHDVLYGGVGNDTVRGGAGNDLIDTTGGAVPLPDIGYPGFYAPDADPNDNRDLVYGGAGDDTIRTGDDADTIYGGQGNDQIDAGVDADYVVGGHGDDTIIGGEGADTIHGGPGNDLIYGGLGDLGGDLLDLPDDVDLRPGNNTDLLYGGDGNDTIYGRDDDDTIYGGGGNDLAFGGVDDDLVYGRDGDDTLNGDAGNDTLYGGIGSDLLDGGAGDDVLYGGTSADTLSGGDGNDLIEGGGGRDLLFGGAGNDTLYGGAGNDTITMGDGASSVYGGADQDRIVVSSAAAGIGSFVDGNEEGSDWDTLDLTGAGRLSIVYDSDNPENGVVTFYDADRNPTGTMRFINIENVVPCFTPGTMIATPKGEVPVESLRAGDRVITRDNGIQQVRWAGRRDLSAADLLLAPHLQPVLIRQGALGHGLPERDMMVSPNHRLLVANERTSLYFDEHEVLVAAKHMLGHEGIRSVRAAEISYIHFMCDRHEVVLSNGAWTETFQPGDLTLKGMGEAQRAEIFEIFPELQKTAGLSDYTAARRTLRRHEAVLLAR